MTTKPQEPLAFMPPKLRRLASRIKGRVYVPNDRIVKRPYADVFPHSAAQVVQERSFENIKPGDRVPGEGIYLGLWSPIDRRATPIGRNFHVFLAPEDLADSLSQEIIANFRLLAQEVAGKRNWHGHDGLAIKDDIDLYAKLERGKGISKWFVPPIELLAGSRLGDNGSFQKDSLIEHRGKGAFASVKIVPGENDEDITCFDFVSCSIARLDNNKGRQLLTVHSDETEVRWDGMGYDDVFIDEQEPYRCLLCRVVPAP